MMIEKIGGERSCSQGIMVGRPPRHDYALQTFELAILSQTTPLHLTPLTATHNVVPIARMVNKNQVCRNDGLQYNEYMP